MATKTKKLPKDKYKPNQFVVHPHHGAAKVIRKVNKNVEIFVVLIDLYKYTPLRGLPGRSRTHPGGVF